MNPTNLWLLTLFLSVSVCHSDPVEIFVPNGPIGGEKYSVLGRTISRFLGIPYAKPPVGPLRFRRPQPIDKWTQRIDANQWPPNCIQTGQRNPERFRNQNFTEDCLYLNIWSPDVNAQEHNLRPVLIWIHGGAFYRGGTSDQLFNLDKLAVMADTVTVSINYRLSVFGFIYMEDDPEIRGNQGLWDQALALRWINENIRYFGGDPKSITLMGNSAGSWSVSLHLLSPISRNLFHRAIMLSGAADRLILGNRNRWTEVTNKLTNDLNCSSETTNIVQCLTDADAQTLKESFGAPRISAIVDGEFIPNEPAKMLAEGNHKKNFNLLVSTVEDEGSFIFARNNPRFTDYQGTPITLAEARQTLLNAVAKMVDDSIKLDNETIIRIYYSGLNEHHDDPDLFKRRTGIAFGDLLITCPTLSFAKRIYRSDPETITVYQWYYRVKLGRIKDLCTKWSGTCHCDELYPVFGVPFDEQQQHLYHNRERDISREIIEFIRSFIRTGQPGKDQPEWLPYFLTSTKMVMAPYYEISNQYKTFDSFKFNLKQIECDIGWNFDQ